MKNKTLTTILIALSGIALANEEYPITQQIQNPSTLIGVANLCSVPVWIQYTGPDSSLPQIVKIDPLNQYDYPISSVAGTSSLRFTPKFYCDSNGANCSMGAQSDSPTVIPSINTLFEATIKPSESSPTTFDISLVDGFTIPVVAKVFQAEDETNGACTDVNDGNLPTPPFMLDPSSPTYNADVANFNNICKASFSDGSHNSFLTPYVSNDTESGGLYEMTWFSGVPTNSTNVLNKFTPVIVNPNAIMAQGGNSQNKTIACASPSGRLYGMSPIQAESYAADGQGVLHGAQYWTDASKYKYDADILMATCPFSGLDVESELNNGTSAYLSPYDASQGVSAANNPFYQLVQLFKSNPQFISLDAKGNPVYNASLLCKYSPAASSYWTQTIHNLTTFTYAYSYDDDAGTRHCDSLKSHVVFVTCGQQN